MSSNDKDKNPAMEQQQREEGTTSPTPQTVMQEAEDHAKQNHSPRSCASLSLLEKVNSVACKYIRKSREAEKRAEAAEKALQEANERADKAEKALQEANPKLDKQRQQFQKLKLQFEAAKANMAVLSSGFEDLELDSGTTKSDNLEPHGGVLFASDERWEEFLSKVPKHDAQFIRDRRDKRRAALARGAPQIPKKPASSSVEKMLHLMEYPEAFQSFEFWTKMMEDDSWHDDDEWRAKNPPKYPGLDVSKYFPDSSFAGPFPREIMLVPPELPISIDQPIGDLFRVREQSKGLHKQSGSPWMKKADHAGPPSPSTSFQETGNPAQPKPFPGQHEQAEKLGNQVGGSHWDKFASTKVPGISGIPAPADPKRRSTSVQNVPIVPEQKKELPSTETDDQKTPKPAPLPSTPPTQPAPAISPPVAVKTPEYRSMFGPYSPVNQQPESSRHLDGSDASDRNPRASITAETPTPSPKKTKKDKTGKDELESDMLRAQSPFLRAEQRQKEIELLVQRFRQNSREYEEVKRGLDAAIAPTLAQVKKLDEKEITGKQNQLDQKIPARPQPNDLGSQTTNARGNYKGYLSSMFTRPIPKDSPYDPQLPAPHPYPPLFPRTEEQAQRDERDRIMREHRQKQRQEQLSKAFQQALESEKEKYPLSSFLPTQERMEFWKPVRDLRGAVGLERTASSSRPTTRLATNNDVDEHDEEEAKFWRKD